VPHMHSEAGVLPAMNKCMERQVQPTFIFVMVSIICLTSLPIKRNSTMLFLSGLLNGRWNKWMLKRRKKKQLDNLLTKGPGSFIVALGIMLDINGVSLRSPELLCRWWLCSGKKNIGFFTKDWSGVCGSSCKISLSFLYQRKTLT